MNIVVSRLVRSAKKTNWSGLTCNNSTIGVNAAGVAFSSAICNYNPWDTRILKTTYPECTISHHFETTNS